MAVILLNESKYINNNQNKKKHESRLIKTFHDLTKTPYVTPPKGVFGSQATIKCGDVTIKSSELDLEFTVPFDDDLIPNEAEIIVYNLTKNTISKLKYKSKITIEAGYKGDTGVIFSGFISKVTTKLENADKVTRIKCLDDVTKRTVSNITFKKGTKASTILKSLLKKTNTPIAVFKVRRDWTYKDEVSVDGDLMEEIKKYAEVCGISVFVSKGKIYARYIKDGDNLNFTLSADTGLIGSPEEFEEEQTAEDFKETVKGYKCECLLQHRMTTAGIINLNSMLANGRYRIRSGEHIFNESEALTKVEVI